MQIKPHSVQKPLKVSAIPFYNERKKRRKSENMILEIERLNLVDKTKEQLVSVFFGVVNFILID